MIDGSCRASVSNDMWKHTLLCLREICSLNSSPRDVSVIAVVFWFSPRYDTSQVFNRSLVNRVASDCQTTLGALLVDGQSGLIVFTNSWNTLGEFRRLRSSLDCVDLLAAESVIMYACDRASASNHTDVAARRRSP